MIDKEELITKINGILAEEFETDENLMSPEKPIMETLELDSLDLVDIAVLVEQNFGFKITAVDFKSIVTFQNFYDFICDKLRSKGC